MTTSTLTRHTASTEDIAHITALVANVRPDWDAGLVRLVLLSHRDQVDAADLAVATIRAAQNPDYRTPKSIGWRGPHWDGSTTRPPAVVERERCTVCGKVESRCYGDRPGRDDDHEFEARA